VQQHYRSTQQSVDKLPSLQQWNGLKQKALDGLHDVQLAISNQQSLLESYDRKTIIRVISADVSTFESCPATPVDFALPSLIKASVILTWQLLFNTALEVGLHSHPHSTKHVSLLLQTTISGKPLHESKILEVLYAIASVLNHAQTLCLHMAPLAMLSRPFLDARKGSDSEALHCLELLMSFCHNKQHSTDAIGMLINCLLLCHGRPSGQQASISMLAAIVNDIGMLLK
jgi:hypothetical protein